MIGKIRERGIGEEEGRRGGRGRGRKGGRGGEWKRREEKERKEKKEKRKERKEKERRGEVKNMQRGCSQILNTHTNPRHSPLPLRAHPEYFYVLKIMGFLCN
jgi:hypothetical protein